LIATNFSRRKLLSEAIEVILVKRTTLSTFLFLFSSFFAGSAVAQSMYRCGNVYQDRQCESTTGTRVGSTNAAPLSAPREKVGSAVRMESPVASSRAQMQTSHYPQAQISNSVSANASTSSANEERARIESVAKSNKARECASHKASVEDNTARQRVGGNVHVM
jgi:hypothetical protein